MTNPQKDRGARAERELAIRLTVELGTKVDRRKNLGTRKDIGDLLLADTTIQCSAVPDKAARIAERARQKIADVEAQRVTQGATFAAVALRIDRALPDPWRFVVSATQARLFGCDLDTEPWWWEGDGVPLGQVIRWAPALRSDWVLCEDLWVSSLPSWCAAWRRAQAAKTDVVVTPVKSKEVQL